MKLTDANVAKLTLPDGKDEKVWWDDDVPGFGYRLRKQLLAIVPTWVFFYRLGGKQHKPKIGDWPAMPAKVARTIAVKWYAQTRLGQDPAAEKKAQAVEPQGETVRSALDLYLARQAGLLRPRSLVELRRHVLVHAEALHGLQLALVDRRAIASVLARLGVSSGPVAANAVRASLNAFFSWAAKEGLIDANPVMNTNRFPTHSREHVLSDDEIRAIWRATAGDGPYNAIVRLLLLLGCRRQEIGALLWSEIDFDAALISLPPARTKTARLHMIPLSPQALSILRAQPHNGDHVFGVRGFSSWSENKALLDERSGVVGWRIHDCRRALSTRMHEDLGVAPHIVESILGHTQKGVAGIYNRSSYLTERRRVLTLWSEHLLTLVGEGRPAEENVLAFAGRPQ